MAIEELKRRYPIEIVVELLGGEVLYDDVSPQGWMRTKCPGHDDQTASAAINPEGDYFTCSGCSLHGDVFAIVLDLVDDVESFREAVAWVEKHVAPISFTTDNS